MKLVLRYRVRNKIKEKAITVKNARFHYRRLKRKYFYVDLIFIDSDGTEHCLA